MLVFVSEKVEEILPPTKLLHTNLFLGSASMPEERKIIVNSFQRGVIKFSMYQIDETYSASLINEISIDSGDCTGSGLEGKFVSPSADAFVSVWGDLSNNSFFGVAVLSIPSTTAAHVVSQCSIGTDELPLGFLELADVHFTKSDAVYTSRAYTFIEASPKILLILQVYLTGITRDSDLSLEFHSVVVLPFELKMPGQGQFESKIMQYKQVHEMNGFSERFLIKVELFKKESVDGHHSFGIFLLKVPTNEVLDSLFSNYSEVCCIDHTSSAIVRVVESLAETTFSEAMDLMMMNPRRPGQQDAAAVLVERMAEC